MGVFETIVAFFVQYLGFFYELALWLLRFTY